ncbi:MAG: electron transport complex subunit RsxG [Pasteurellaceae bacterium]|nr:electron transport complex subunit RsxG [Pasteurellaceae bacterium]
MNISKITAKYGTLLGFSALACTVISAGIYFLTKSKIDLVIADQQRELLLQVVPQDYFDNDLLGSCSKTDNPQIRKLYTAKKGEQLTAYAFETVAPDGYSGKISLLVGMTPTGEVLGVRTIEHHETPGLGDKIELRLSNWILSFNHQQLTQQNLSDWAVKKDGGKFDQFAGATITPRAVVNQVKRAALQMLTKPVQPLEPCQ